TRRETSRALAGGIGRRLRTTGTGPLPPPPRPVRGDLRGRCRPAPAARPDRPRGDGRRLGVRLRPVAPGGAMTTTLPCRTRKPDCLSQEDEADLVARARAGDEGACATLVRRHSGALLACAERILGCWAERADPDQAALVSALRSLPSFAGGSRLGTWLHRIVVNACLMRLRRRRRHPTVSLDGLLPAFDESGRLARPSVRWAEQPLARLEREEVRA